MIAYFDFLRRNARFLGFGVGLMFFASLGQTYYISIYGGIWRDTFALSHGEYGLVYSLATLVSAALLTYAGRLIDHLDLRLFALLTAAGLALACAGMAFVPDVLALTLGIFMLRFFGQGLMGHAAMTSMARYFEAERGKAISVATLGVSAGIAFVPGLGVWLIELVGWRESFLIAALVFALIVPPVIALTLKGHGERHRTYTATIAGPRPLPRVGGDDEADRTDRQWSRAELLRDPRFYLLQPAAVAPAFLLTGFFFHQVHVAEAKGWSIVWLASSLSAFAAGQLAALVLSGALVDTMGARRLARLYLLPMIAGLGVLATLDAAWSAPVYLLFCGVTTGGSGPVMGALWAELYGVQHIGSIRALTSAIMVSSTALSPFGMGYLIDAGLAIEWIAGLSIVFTVLAVILVLTVFRR